MTGGQLLLILSEKRKRLEKTVQKLPFNVVYRQDSPLANGDCDSDVVIVIVISDAIGDQLFA